MLYNTICIRLPITTTLPASALNPYEAAEDFLDVDGEAPELVPVPVPVLDPLRLLVASAVVLQVKTPWISPLLRRDSKAVQEMLLVLWMLKPPLTFVRSGMRGLNALLAVLKLLKLFIEDSRGEVS
jgi:hypothetical protein